MSGPKCMEIAYVPMAEACQYNPAQIQEWLTAYTRLFAELAALGRRSAALGSVFSPASPSDGIRRFVQ